MKILPVILSLFLPTTTMCAETEVLLPDPAKVAADEKDIFVATSIPGDFTTMEGLLAALFFLADQAADETLTNPFLPQAIRSTSQFEGALPLGSYFRGVERTGSAVTISFS